MHNQRNGGPRPALHPKPPAPPPASQLRVKRVTPSPELDFVAGVAAVHGGVFFRVDGCAHVRAEVCGERCTLFLSEAAWGELVRQAELLDVEEFGTKSRDFIYELPLRRAYVLHRGETQIVVATRGHVLLALRHPLPD